MTENELLLMFMFLVAAEGGNWAYTLRKFAEVHEHIKKRKEKN